ncbi:hypothetical protein BJV77DRAFT_686669 [Russula vinacea]|nr:hypothetical protein BJV77DRAFT_686669 [Russula vinacea]
MGTLTIDLNRWVDRTGEFMFIFSPDKGVHCKLGADDLAFSIEPTVCTPCRPGSVGRTVSIDSFLKECMVREALEGDLTDYDYTDEEDGSGELVGDSCDTPCELQAAQHHDGSTVYAKCRKKDAGRRTGRRCGKQAYAEAQALQQGQCHHGDTTFASPEPLKDTGRCSRRRHRQQASQLPQDEDSDPPTPPLRSKDSERRSARRRGKRALQQVVGTPEDDTGLKQIVKKRRMESTENMFQLGFYIDSCIDLTVPGWITAHPNGLPEKVFTKEELLRDYQMQSFAWNGRYVFYLIHP